jgi:hypothetical protein
MDIGLKPRVCHSISTPPLRDCLDNDRSLDISTEARRFR